MRPPEAIPQQEGFGAAIARHLSMVVFHARPPAKNRSRFYFSCVDVATCGVLRAQPTSGRDVSRRQVAERNGGCVNDLFNSLFQNKKFYFCYIRGVKLLGHYIFPYLQPPGLKTLIFYVGPCGRKKAKNAIEVEPWCAPQGGGATFQGLIDYSPTNKTHNSD